MTEIEDKYINSRSFAIAGLYDCYIPDTEFAIGDYITIVPKGSRIERIYLNKIKGLGIRDPDYYLVGNADDNRFITSARQLNSIDDALSSLSLVNQALSIFFSRPCPIGPILGFDGGGTAYGHSKPTIPGYNNELNHPAYNIPITVSHRPFRNYEPNLHFKEFFSKFAHSCAVTKDYQWMMAANRFTQGINNSNVHDIVLNISISLEALFTRGNEDISYKARTFAALLVGNSYQERKVIQKDIKEFYTLRSKLVHGNKTTIEEKDMDLIKRILKYVSRALVATCGRKMNDVHTDLEFMSLLGMPKLSKDKVTVTIDEDEIVRFMVGVMDIADPYNYRITMTEPNEYEEEGPIIEFIKDQQIIESVLFDEFLWMMPHVHEHHNYSHWISCNDGKYKIYLTYLKDD